MADKIIDEALQALPVPECIFCERGIAAVTLDQVHDLMDFLNECDMVDVEHPERWREVDRQVLRTLRKSATVAIQYARKLTDLEDEKRRGARREAAEAAHV